MVGRKTARWFMVCGCAAAVIGAIGGLLFAASLGSFDTFNLVQVAVLFGLGVGIYRASRICALLAFGIYLFERANLYYTALALQSARGGAGVMEGFWISVVIFSALYILGIIGAFSWHAGATPTLPQTAIEPELKSRKKSAPQEP